MNIKIILAFILALSAWQINADNSEYISGQAGKKEAESYSKIKNISTSYLANRDLQSWLDLVKGKQALDYGSGTGASIDFLLAKGFKVTGADINPDMISQAQKAHPKTPIVFVKDAQLPFADKSFDLVFSSLVLFELKDKAEIKQYATQARRVLKDDGYFVAITGSSHMHDPKYQSTLRKSDFPENHNAASGDIVRVHLNEVGITFSDYLWFENDYRQAFEQAGLPICAVHYPLGKNGEDYQWVEETTRSPVLLILAAKDCENISNLRIDAAKKVVR